MSRLVNCRRNLTISGTFSLGLSMLGPFFSCRQGAGRRSTASVRGQGSLIPPPTCAGQSRSQAGVNDNRLRGSGGAGVRSEPIGGTHAFTAHAAAQRASPGAPSLQRSRVLSTS